MVQRLPEGYRVDPADPRAPSEAEWAQMTPAQRARVVEMLPAAVPLRADPPEGDFHFKAKVKAHDTLGSFFRRIGRKIYLSSELGVYYPDEPRFAPDLLAVTDVEPHERTKWVVADEGKGLDWVLEVYYQGDFAKDIETNVKRYARLGIPEYFVFDRRRLSLHGYRLPSAAEGQTGKPRAYRPILPQGGRYASHVLGLELSIEETKLRFLYGAAPVPEAEEMVAKLESMVDKAVSRAEEAEKRVLAEAARVAALERSLADLVEHRLGRALTEKEQAVFAERLPRLLGENRVGDVLLGMDATALAAWLADPAAT